VATTNPIIKEINSERVTAIFRWWRFNRTPN
jgi:hypothetical protein